MDTAKKNIEVKFSKRFAGVSAAWAQRVVSETLKLEKSGHQAVSVLLTGNKEIRRINKEFLKHDYATDVISFGADEKGFLGDLAVSVEMASQIAKDLKIEFKEELARYLVHGTLHLLGYEDEDEKKKKRMHARQEIIIKKILQNA